MNETYVEQLVARKKNPFAGVIKGGLYALCGICAVMGLLGYFALFLAAIVLFLISYFVAPLFDIEYEYLYLSKEISIDKVISKQRRRHAFTIDLNKAEIIALSSSHELDSYRNRQCAKMDFSSGLPDRKIYTIAYADKDSFTLIDFEPDEEMLKAIKQVFPRKVVEY